MIFHRKQKKIKDINISIDNVQIERVNTFNFLGIMLDESLTWTDHTNMVANKISRVTGVLHRLKNIFPKEILLTLYNTLILSYINYGLLVWGVKSSRIDLPRKKAIRLVTNSSYFAHTTPLFPAEGLLNPIRSGGGGALKAPPLRFFALTHLILELHYCALVTFPKK